MVARIGIATNNKILDLFNRMKSGELILRPSFQRKLVWNDRHKEAFIETILKGLPFPEIYLASGDIDLDSQESKTLVVDGQQRLNTIYEYIMGSPSFKLKSIQPFAELTPKEKTSFYDYQVVVRDLERIDEVKLREIFNRINSIQYALNAMEINNALYEGEYITCAKIILDDSMLSKIEIFSETEYSRMRDLEFVLLIMSTVEEKGYFNGLQAIENFIKEFDSNYPGKKSMASDFKNCLKIIIDLKLSPDSLWLRKSSFFNLVVELIFFKRKNGFFPDVKSLKRKLTTLENLIIKDKNDNIEKNKHAKYYYYVFSGTASRKARVTRGELIREYLLSLK